MSNPVIGIVLMVSIVLASVFAINKVEKRLKK